MERALVNQAGFDPFSGWLTVVEDACAVFDAGETGWASTSPSLSVQKRPLQPNVAGQDVDALSTISQAYVNCRSNHLPRRRLGS